MTSEYAGCYRSTKLGTVQNVGTEWQYGSLPGIFPATCPGCWRAAAAAVSECLWSGEWWPVTATIPRYRLGTLRSHDSSINSEPDMCSIGDAGLFPPEIGNLVHKDCHWRIFADETKGFRTCILISVNSLYNRRCFSEYCTSLHYSEHRQTSFTCLLSTHWSRPLPAVAVKCLCYLFCDIKCLARTGWWRSLRLIMVLMSRLPPPPPRSCTPRKLSPRRKS